MEITIAELQKLGESEDHIEFKEAKHNYPFAGGKHVDLKDRRRCVLGCIVALANEKGGRLVLGMEDLKCTPKVFCLTFGVHFNVDSERCRHQAISR